MKILSITAGAAAMGRPLNDEERAKLDSLAAEFDGVRADIARLETIERQKASMSAASPGSRSSWFSAQRYSIAHSRLRYSRCPAGPGEMRAHAQ